MSIKVVLYDSDTHCEIKEIGDGFPSEREANQFRYSTQQEKGTFTKMEQSDTPINQSFFQNIDYSEGDVLPIQETPKKDSPFYFGWILCAVLIAGIVFFLLNPV